MAAVRKEQWKSGFGFVLAAAGSAVGLGNLWGFAYRASQGGGGSFVLLYLLIVGLICLPVLVAEMVLGRTTGSSPLLAPSKAAGKAWWPMGWMFIAASCGILAFYAVLMGWTGHTLVHALQVGLPENKQAADAFFDSISGGNSALAGQGISLLLTALVVAAGVQAGIERLSRWALPLLLLLLIGLAIWASTLPGAGEGYRTFLLRWDGEELMNISTIRNAFSQAFFSIGTGIGSILAYSVYLNRKAPLPQEAVAVVGLDTAVGLLAGMLTFPVVISFNLGEVVSDSTIGAIFIALPTGLSSIGETGRVVAVLFFALAYLAAITSAVSLLEVPVSSLMDRLSWSRGKATWVSAAVIFVVGIPASMSLEVLETMDALFGGVLLIAGGLLIAVLMGWVVPNLFLEDLQQSAAASPLLRRVLMFCLRWISPVVIAAGLLISTVDLLRNWSYAA
ncbi:sodium-dependent transporter [Synechococcus sp. CS-197]|uniref:sodium-dependent transporter n=1 Tax=Synechococcus sp. CS-197 TaxID=2847985 RepID=UPI000152550D|nr:sodium-dependent transporter [Synechococcus sp. CS-197]MCT0250867.1 sodium-dependent transporter [Synechococcus sp. CS-197]CAK24047.1 Sodium-dependent transporter of the SNF family [Synechococcus sp. WH 7803]